jgi:hypothetical protein
MKKNTPEEEARCETRRRNTQEEKKIVLYKQTIREMVR